MTDDPIHCDLNLSSPREDTSADTSDSNDQSEVERNDTGSGTNISDDPKPKGLGDAWKDIPMSQAIEFIPVLTTSDLKDIARYKSKVVVARINEQISTQKERMSQQREKMSQSLAIQREKMSQSLSQQREKMSQQREKMSQSITQQREKMSQQREKMSQSFTQQKERVSQSLSNQKEKMTQQRENMILSISMQKDKMTQSLSNQKEKINLRGKQMREQMSAQAARVHQMSEIMMAQVKTRLGPNMATTATREFEMDLETNFRDVQTSPEHTPICRKKKSLSQSCPNLIPGLLELPGPRDNLSICSYGTSVSARSSHSDLSMDSQSPFSDVENTPPNTPLNILTPQFTTSSPILSITDILTPSPCSQAEICPPLPKWAHPRPPIALLTHPQLPDWYKDNECIRKFYRPPLKSFKKCIKSIGYWHCETGNIWSHLLGIVLFLGYLPHFGYSMFTRAKDLDFTWIEPTVISVFLFSAVTCLFLSTFFHTFLCHSKKLSVLCLRLDYCGISFLILGTEVPWVYYLFFCLRTVQIAYLSICVILGVTAIITMIAPLFNSPRFRIFRALLFGCVGSFGLIPALHAMGVQGFVPAMSLGGIGLMFCGGMFYIVGAGIYAIRLPERIFPGKCDLLIQSHTIFHICVLIAATFHYFSLLRIQEIRLLRGGFCNPDINI